MQFKNLKSKFFRHKYLAASSCITAHIVGRHLHLFLLKMEEYDDLATGPIDGVIDLSHDTWRTLPPELSGFSTTLLHLKMSNNNLSTIPASIGDLILLKSLDVSINQIESIDKAIGKCIRLRRLNVASNRIESFPEEIAECILLVSDCIYFSQDVAISAWE